MNLTTQNSVSPECTFGIVTKGREYLASAYLDHYAAEIDALCIEQAELRKSATDSLGAVTVDSMSGLLAGLLGEIEEAKSLKALRASDAAKAAMTGTVSISEQMVVSGVSRRITAILHRRTHHSETALVWALAVYLNIDGDLNTYFGAPTAWPPVKGDDAEKFESVRVRVAFLQEIPVLDLARLLKGVNEHLKGHAELMETEVKN